MYEITQFSDLPDEITEYIISNVNDPRDLASLAAVCLEFGIVAKFQ